MVKLIEKIERSSGKVKTLYLGIPAQFCVVRTVYEKIVFPKPKKFTSYDLEDLYNENDPFAESGYTRIHADAVYFFNDKGERVHSPVGTVTSFLKAQLSYIGVETDVDSFLKQGLMRYGVKTVNFIQSEYAASLALFSEEERDAGVILADIGYLATSVLYVGGDALLELKTFSLGGSLIPMGLSEALGISFNVATALANKVNLGYKDEGEYTLKYEASTYSFPVEQINGMVRECIQCLVTYIKKAINAFRFDTSPYATIFLTGGGLSEIRFAREYVSKCFGRSVEIVQPAVPNFDKPYYSTAVGLLKQGMANEKKETFGFFKRLFRF